MQKPVGRFLVAIGSAEGKPMSRSELIQSVADRNKKLYTEEEAEDALSLLKANEIIDDELALTKVGAVTFKALQAQSNHGDRYYKFFRPSENPNVGEHAPKAKLLVPLRSPNPGLSKVA